MFACPCIRCGGTALNWRQIESIAFHECFRFFHVLLARVINTYKRRANADAVHFREIADVINNIYFPVVHTHLQVLAQSAAYGKDVATRAALCEKEIGRCMRTGQRLIIEFENALENESAGGGLGNVSGNFLHGNTSDDFVHAFWKVYFDFATFLEAHLATLERIIPEVLTRKNPQEVWKSVRNCFVDSISAGDIKVDSVAALFHSLTHCSKFFLLHQDSEKFVWTHCPSSVLTCVRQAIPNDSKGHDENKDNESKDTHAGAWFEINVIKPLARIVVALGGAGDSNNTAPMHRINSFTTHDQHLTSFNDPLPVAQVPTIHTSVAFSQPIASSSTQGVPQYPMVQRDYEYDPTKLKFAVYQHPSFHSHSSGLSALDVPMPSVSAEQDEHLSDTSEISNNGFDRGDDANRERDNIDCDNRSAASSVVKTVVQSASQNFSVNVHNSAIINHDIRNSAEVTRQQHSCSTGGSTEYGVPQDEGRSTERIIQKPVPTARAEGFATNSNSAK